MLNTRSVCEKRVMCVTMVYGSARKRNIVSAYATRVMRATMASEVASILICLVRCRHANDYGRARSIVQQEAQTYPSVTGHVRGSTVSATAVEEGCGAFRYVLRIGVKYGQSHSTPFNLQNIYSGFIEYGISNLQTRFKKYC